MKKLNRKLIQIITVLAAFGLAVPSIAFAQSDQNNQGDVSANGLNYYYEIHGTEEIHGKNRF